MMEKKDLKILGVSGSLRKESFNKRLLALALSSAERHGAVVSEIDLSKTPVPFYDADLEARDGLPSAVQALKKQFMDADGLMIATPEYNGFFPGVLKNCLDWLSRRSSLEDPILSSYDGKVAGLMSATVGGSGGVRSMTALTTQLQYLGVMVLPRPFSMAHAGKVFSDSGTLSPELLSSIDELTSALIAKLRKLKQV
ncbi:MAG: NAD(P)H-dependent oxidoreductase [Proteobacteria bacterium]|nr:NAD(P)H-dependent oxidoreductase [Pseudomonadota bacterium]MDA1332474.1 NAD(P)H-dependent oxidoreductase [Pseudomonadota bacterium]